MQPIIDTFKNTGKIHHAYCIEGKREELVPLLYDFLENVFDFRVSGNPDLFKCECDTLTIDDARNIKEFHVCKSFGESGRKIFIIAAHFMSRESQNALLKIFEEPAAGNYFFIVTPSSNILLPTLRSRLIIVASSSGDPGNAQAKKIIASSIPDRLAMIQELTESISDDEKSKMDALLLVNAIETEFMADRRVSHLDAREIEVVEMLEKSRSYLGDRAPSVKLILEHIALIL